MYNHLVLKPQKTSQEPERIEPIPNCLRLADIEPSERAKLSKFGLDMISRGKCKITLSALVT